MVRLAALLACLLGPLPAAGDDDDRAGEELFELKIRPVLVQNCFKCHGADKQSNGLRLDSREAILKGGESGPAVVPGDPAKSLLLRAIRHEDEDLQMPPKKRLPEAVVAEFESWIRRGAPWPARTRAAANAGRHWSFLPVRAPEPPDLPPDHPLDRFLEAARAKAGLRAVGEADRRILIRRATFDLHGLPPAPEEVDAFVNDPSPDAFERLVDRLLASPRYGERWGRHWLDLARYADTAGDDSDYPVPQARLYRDWVIDAFNRDMPFDEFVVEQLAGDLLAPTGPRERYADRIVATGFVAQAKRFATHKHEDMHLVIEDTIHTVGQAVLGLTLRCARCHDHKYDPISTRDYYALYGFFQSVVYPHAGSEEEPKPSELIPLVPPDELKAREEAWLKENGARLEVLQAELRKVEKESENGRRLEALRAEVKELEPKKAEEAIRQRLREKRDEIARLEKIVAEKAKPAREALAAFEKDRPAKKAPLAYSVKEGKPADAKVQIGGDPRRTGDLVPRGVPRILDPEGGVRVSGPTSGRLELARWIASPSNPLTARVLVNRLWQHHFGKGLVATPSDFGTQGEPPTHPELLDWLARQLVEKGWSIKSMHRLLMTSRAYRLSSAHDAANDERDPDNRFVWRFDRRRLDAEALRDSMLLLGGNLNLDRPGPHPFPSSENWRFSAHRQFKAVYPSDHRSVFLMTQRLHPHPYLSLFNAADTNESTGLRDESTVPLQALYLSNSGFVHQQARGLARRLLQAEPAARAALAYRLAYARKPTGAEERKAQEYVRRYAVQAGEEEAWASLARVLLMSNEFIYVD